MKRNVSLLLCVALTFCAFAQEGGPVPGETEGKTWYVEVAGDDSRSGLSGEEAFATVSAALAVAGDADRIVVGEGRHEIRETLAVTNGVTLCGAGMDRTFLVKTEDKTFDNLPIVRMDASNAVLRDLTITGGRAPAGAAVRFYRTDKEPGDGGTLLRCRITGNRATGAGYKWGVVKMESAGSRLIRCIIDDNHAHTQGASWGGGVSIYKGLLESCLIAGNSALQGGGIAVHGAATIRNCTIAGNHANGKGGGLLWYTGATVAFQNTIVSGNSAPDDPGEGKPDWALDHVNNRASFVKSLDHCLIGQGPIEGAESLWGEALFRDPAAGDFSLLAGSPAIDAGVALPWSSPVDLEGAPRVQGAAADLGCLEFAPSSFSCGFTSGMQNALEGEPIPFRSAVYGAADPQALSFRWVFEAPRTGRRLESTEPSPLIAIADAGRYDVTLTVTDQSTGETASMARPGLLLIAPRVCYFGSASAPAFPWKTPETAGDDLSTMLRELVDGSTIVLAEGTYGLTNQVIVDKGVSLLGAGVDRTVFVPSGPDVHSRLFKLNHGEALLQGVTLKGARYDGQDGKSGMAVLIGGGGGTLRLCRATACESIRGINSGCVSVQSPAGLVSRCIVDCNTNQGTHPYCYSAGLYLVSGRAENTLVSRNVNRGSVAALFCDAGAKAVHCTFAGNESLGSSSYAVGGYFGYNGSLVNCLFARNAAPNGERNAGWPEWHLPNMKQTNSVFRNCFFGDSLAVGRNAVSGDPCFRNEAAGDYSIRRCSPARNAGLYEEWMATAVDLAGNPRVDRGQAVDIGCYEATYVPPKTLLMIR